MDALSRLPLDNVHLLGTEKMTLATPEATKDVLRHLHEGDHLGLKKTLKLFGIVFWSPGEDSMQGGDLRMPRMPIRV